MAYAPVAYAPAVYTVLAYATSAYAPLACTLLSCTPLAYALLACSPLAYAPSIGKFLVWQSNKVHFGSLRLTVNRSTARIL